MCKIVISGTSAEIKGLHRHPTIKMWADQGHKVSYKTLASATGQLSNPNTVIAGVGQPVARFSDILLEKVNAQPHLLTTFQMVFGLSASYGQAPVPQ